VERRTPEPGAGAWAYAGAMTERAFSPLATAFRPFFLAAGLMGALAVLAWVLMLLRGAQLFDSDLGPFGWHGHEMLFGFTGAVLAGFLLTAVSNWTGRATLSGWPLAALLLLWCAGRAAAAYGARLPAPVPPLVDAAFFAALAAATGRAIVAARSWRNLPFPILVALLGACDVIFHLAMKGSVSVDMMARAMSVAVASIALVIVLFGGRIVPMFTKNATGAAVRARGWVDRLGVAALVALIAAGAVAPGHAAGHWIAIAAGAVNAARLWGWGGSRTLGRPILWILHAAWLLLSLGLLLLGASGLTAHVPASAARHLLFVGGFATMMLGMMARVSLGHTGRELRASIPVAVAFALILVATAARVGAALLLSHYVTLVWTAAIAWTAAFALFAIYYAPILLSPRADGKPG
jgi:uncharacterized protein involved in response to NO